MSQSNHPMVAQCNKSGIDKFSKLLLAKKNAARIFVCGWEGEKQNTASVTRKW